MKYVYVISKSGRPLMPTRKFGMVRHMLKEGKAHVLRQEPFTIQLDYESGGHVQPVSLGVDAGYQTIGLSATTGDEVLFEAEVELRQDIKGNLDERRTLRRSRRGRKTRYRKPRFDNRGRKDGWYPPSVETGIAQHVAAVEFAQSILPVSDITVEVASFDIHKLKDPDVEGKGYQEGGMKGFENVKAYIRWRDGHTCQACKGKSGDRRLEVHHIIPREKHGADRPDNLVTLCHTCHREHHDVKPKKLPKPAPGFMAPAFMNASRWEVVGRLRASRGGNVRVTYGYATKVERITRKLPKAHHVDARCISGHPSAASDGTVYVFTKHRSHNRRLYKVNTKKGGRRQENQAPRKVFGFALNDIVRHKGSLWRVHGRRSRGVFVIKSLDDKIQLELSCRKLKLVKHAGTYLIRKEVAAFPASGQA